MDPTGLVDKFRDLVLNQIWDQLLYLIYYHRNIDQLNGQLMELTLARSSVQHRIDEAINNVEQIEEEVLHWLFKVDELSEQVQKFHEESRAKPECSITSCPNPWLRLKLSKRAKAMAEEGAKIYAKRNFDRISYSKPLPSMLELTNREGNEGIDSRVPIMDQILEELKNPGVNMIGLCGLGGVGKTTMAKEVVKNQKIFEKVIMATVSQDLNIENIQGQIAGQLSMQLNEDRASRLHERLKREKNMLLILDDLWEELDFCKVGIPFVSVENYSKKNEGCKILVTSRKKELLSDLMKCQKIVEVGVLSENEALELFKKIAELSTDTSSPELISRATDIVRKCGGLPLAIATAAKTLRNKDLNEFEDALARLNNPLRRNNTLTREVDTILKWSYDRLGSSEYRRIFLLAAMLSHDLSIEDLIMYSVGLDVLDGIESMEEAHVGISTAVRKLKSSNLFLDSISSHHFTIHDVFRDVAWRIASDELHAFIRRRLREWPDKNMLQGCEGICLQESDISDLPEELHGPRLMFFLLNSTRRDLNIPSMFFKSSEELKVLAFTNVHFSSLSSFIFLQKLKALFLHSCLLEDITEIRSLKDVKVLSLAYSEIERLPIEFVELTSLQMLNLSHCSNLREIPQKLLSSLKKLEVLYMGNSFRQWKVEGSSEANENASLDELKDLPLSSLDIQIPNVSMLPKNLFLKMNLRRYSIFIGKRWIWEGNYRTSRILKLELESSIDLTARHRNLSKGVEDLHLYGSNGHENVLFNLDASGFPCLRHLQIESNDDIKYIVLNSAHHEDAFQVLESLELNNLKALENLCEGPNDIVFGQLLTLKMKNLPALIGDFSIKDRATNNAPNKIFKSLFNKVLLPKLEILELSNLNSSIELICDDQLSHKSFSNLKTLMVASCGFVTLMPSHVLKYLKNLEELEVRDCDMLENMFDFEYLNYNEEMESSSVVVPLKKLKLSNLPKLKNMCSNNCQGNRHAVTANLCMKDGATNNASDEIFKSLFNKKVLFPKLEILELFNLNSSIALIWDDQLSHNSFFDLKRLWVGSCGFVKLVPSHVLKYLKNLEELEVWSCHMLEIVFDFEDLKYDKEMESSSVVVPLKKLTLGNLPKLKNMCSNNCQGNRHAVTANLCMKDGATNNASDEISKSLFNKKVLFPKLEILELSNLNSSIALIWDDQLSHKSFSNLKTLMVEGCGFVTLMPSHVLKYLKNLEELEVRDCDMLENMFDFEYLNYNEEMESSSVPLKKLKLGNLPKLKNMCSNNCQGNRHAVTANICMKDGATNNASDEISKSLFNKKVLFPKLEILELSNLNSSIALIWDDQLSHKSFSNLKTLMVEGCGFVTLMPSHVLKYLKNLEELEVWNCDMLEIVFDFEDLKDDKAMESSSSVVVPMKKLELGQLPKLKNVWSNHHQGNVSFPSPRSVHVSYCESLTSIFPASIAKGMLYGLEDVIVAKDQVLESGAVTIEFPNLTYLHLSDLQKLRNFFPHQHTLKLPHLHRLFIQHCDELEIFEKKISSSSEIHEEESTLNSKYPLFSHHDEVIQELEELTLWGKEAEMIGSGPISMYHFPNVKLLSLNARKATTISYRSLLKSFTKLEDLVLSGNFEKAFGGEDVTCFPKLTLSYNSIMRSLSPFLVSSSSLTHLNVNKCYEWTTLMTSSIARSLVHLTSLSVLDCLEMEEIIIKQEGEDDENKEILFRKLKLLKLAYLPKLRKFCRHNYTFRFPLLDKLIIRRCPKFKRFSPGLIDTPSLQSVQLSKGRKHHEIWDTDLNKTFHQQRFVASREVVLDEDDAIMIRNEQFRADHCPQVEILGIEGFVDEWVTFMYTLLERFPKLNALHVENCSFEEIFPSHAPSFSSFHNLILLKVSKCHHLVYLVTSSAVKSLVNLETLEIDECEKLKEIVRIETDNDVERGITFSNLKTLIVKSCDFMKLVPFHVLKSLNNLEKLEVSNCDKLEMLFGFEDLNDYHKEMESSSVIAPLSLTHLEVKGCHGLTTLMMSLAPPNLVHITHLSISNCDQIEEIITKQEGEDNEDKEIFFNQMKFMKLDGLPRLKRFCGYNYTFKFPLLEHVTIKECPHLTMFCLGAIHAPRLHNIRVGNLFSDKDILMTNLSNTIKHLFTFEEVISTTWSMVLNGKNIRTVMGVFPQVMTLYVESFKDEGVTFPYSSLKRFPQLDKLYVEHSSFEEIFPSQDEIIDFMGKSRPLEELYIAYMDKLKSIWKDDSQLPSIHQNLNVLEVKSCCSLVKLAPSSTSFKDLIKLSLSGCHQVIHLVTTSTAKSLVSLKRLTINDCKKMEEIVKNDTNEDVQGGITFNQLVKIKFTDMPSLKMFSSQSHTFKFPKLEKIEIIGCPEMKMFCQGVLETPKLSKVKIEEHDMEWKDEGDVNKTMEGLSLMKDSFNI